jgi:hypothetical protein
MRVQLTLGVALRFALVIALAIAGAPRAAFAQNVRLDTAHTLYVEAPSGSHMTVYTPGVDLQATPFEFLDVRAGWEADVVSGASVAVKAGPAYQANNPSADVVTAASVHDLRNVGKGGFTLHNREVSLTAGYSFSTENDYRSHALNVAARTELFDHNTQLEIAYARNFDSVCDRVQSANVTAPSARALEDSKGCFTSNPLRIERGLDIDGLQGSWSQSWTPVFATQLVYSTQILSGLQSNPYRSVIVGQGLKAAEHHPDNRARQALAARANLFVRPLKAALRLGARGYLDTWDVRSVTIEAAFEKYFGEALRLGVRGRAYLQSGALFWSDDYTGGDAPLGPKGQYFTGDRELSPFSSYLLGLRATESIRAREGKLLGLLTSLELSASADAVQFDYREYTLGGVPVTGARAYVFGLALSAIF